jgi:hypothetical protein
MTKLIRILFFVSILVAVFGCQKEISSELSSGGSVGGVNGILKMKVDGKQWVADRVATASLMAGFINISGLSKDGKTFTITLKDTVARKYILANEITSLDSMHGAALSDSANFSNYSYGTMQGSDPSQAGGWVVISKIDKAGKTMSGTFQLKMFRELDSSAIMITEGVFDKLKFETSLPPSNATDTLSVKIDGFAWKPASITSVVSNGVLAIVANENPLNRTVGLMLPPDVKPGTYDLDALGGQYIGMYNPNSSTGWASESGKVTIIEHNLSARRIRGNFTFLAKPFVGAGSATLTEGYFSIKYP